MDKLMEYICDELEDLERKAAKEGKLSMAEVEYLDKLTHIKKNILKSEEMWEESEYSEEGGSYAGGNSYARGRGRNARRDSMGRYSSRTNEDGNSRMGSYEGNNSGRGGSYGSSYNGYSRADAKEELMMGLHDLEQNTNDEESKRMVHKWIKQLEQG